jgi:hypothetical protein
LRPHPPLESQEVLPQLYAPSGIGRVNARLAAASPWGSRGYLMARWGLPPRP